MSVRLDVESSVFVVAAALCLFTRETVTSLTIFDQVQNLLSLSFSFDRKQAHQDDLHGGGEAAVSKSKPKKAVSKMVVGPIGNCHSNFLNARLETRRRNPISQSNIRRNPRCL